MERVFALALFITALAGVGLGAALAWLASRATLAARDAELAHERRSAQDKVAMLQAAQRDLANTFDALSAQALERNNRSFLDLASASLAQASTAAAGELEQRRQAVEHLVEPLKTTLAKVETQLQSLELGRREAYTALTEQVRSLSETQDRLKRETANLVTALRAPSVRGRWGEMQLRRVVETAGMVRHCDFAEQVTVATVDGVQRPDLVVHLPGGKHLVVDAKVPLEAYLDAAETGDESVRSTRLANHARRLRAHIDALSAKAYWQQFQPSPDVVVLFVPGEAFLAAAWEHDAGLFEYAAARRVLPASPTTLIALLQAVAYGWRQEALADNARAVVEVGRELYKRLATMGEHVTAVGRALDRAVDAYNKQVGSLETRVLVSARRLADMQVGEGDLPSLDPIEKAARDVQSPELTRLAPVPRHDDEVA
jgi:DNA recombination protein RmuC